MSFRAFRGARLALVAAVAFAGGLVIAAGLNLTPFGYAQQRGGPQIAPVQPAPALTDLNDGFVSVVAEMVKK